ncbi:MAG TPA: STAS domain-containing protein [Solirubrobacteraceae bacterium]|nr:STAS domain-containing protein [Solirubrobacteraceae bacterium]
MAAEIPSFAIDVRTDGGRVHFVPRGELDLATAPDLEQRVLETLRSGDGDGVVLDLRELTFMDSTGVRAIVAAHQVAQDEGVDLRLVRPRAGSVVLRVIEISGIDGALGLVDAP